MGEYRIPSSRPDDFRRAIEHTSPIAAKCGSRHPIHGWRESATGAACVLDKGPIRGDADRDAIAALLEYVFLPAARLCRLAYSLGVIDAEPMLAATVHDEIRQLPDPDHFFHGEYVLHIATKAVRRWECPVVLVPTQAHVRTPDIAIDRHRIAIECRAHEIIDIQEWSFWEDFDHAQAKFRGWLASRPGWLGVLAVDLGAIGSPSLPDSCRSGPDLSVVARNIDDGLRRHPDVAAAAVTWVGAVCEPSDDPGVAKVLRAGTASGVRPWKTVDEKRRELLEILLRKWPESPAVAFRSIRS